MSNPPPPKGNVQQRSIWQSYAALPAKTRLRLSLVVTAVAITGIFISNKLDAALPLPSNPPSPPTRDSRSN